MPIKMNTKNRIIASLMVLVLPLSTPLGGAYGLGLDPGLDSGQGLPLSIFVDGAPITLPDAKPFVNGDGRTMVPVRFVSQALGAEVIWNEPLQTVEIQTATTTIKLPLNSKTISVNGSPKTMDTSATLVNGRTMVPVRFVAENLDSTVNFDSSLNRVSVESTVFKALDPLTILVYLNGTDLESGRDEETNTLQGSGSADLDEMMALGSTEAVNMIVETGGTKEWVNKTINPNNNQRFEVKKDSLTLKETLPKSNMGEAATLQNFITWGIEHYPAQRYGIILWNHGGGPIVGYGVDELFEGDGLTLSELDLALKGANKTRPAYFSFVGFDACLMASIETANTLAPYADYLLASQELEPGHGWDYSALLKAAHANPTGTIPSLLSAIQRGFEAQAKDQESDADITLSAISLKHLSPLNRALETLFTKLNTRIQTIDGLADVAKAISDSKAYGGNTEDQGFTNLFDISDAVKNLIPTDTAQIKAIDSALKNAVISQVKGPVNASASGLSIYLPYWAPQDFQWQLDTHKSLSIPTSLRTFAKTFATKLEEDTNIGDLQFTTAGPNAESGNYTLTLQEDQIDYLSDIYLTVYQYIQTGRERFRMLGYDVLVEELEPGIYESSFSGAWTLLQDQPVMLQIVRNDGDMVEYEIPMILNGERVTLVATWYFDESLDAGGYYDIVGARKAIDETTNMPDRDLIKLKVGDRIQPVYTSYYFDKEEYAEDLGTTFTLAPDFKLEFQTMPLADYQLQFTLIDFAGNAFDSDFLEY